MYRGSGGGGANDDSDDDKDDTSSAGSIGEVRVVSRSEGEGEPRESGDVSRVGGVSVDERDMPEEDMDDLGGSPVESMGGANGFMPPGKGG